MTEWLAGARITQTSRSLVNGAVIAGAVRIAVLASVRLAPPAGTRLPLQDDVARALGQALLTRYVLPFELLGVLFLAALLGAIYFARPDE